MVLQQKLNNLKERPHEDKRAVAGGIAIAIVVILIVAWGFLFLRKVRNSDLSSLENTAIPTDQFDLDLIRNTERDQAIYDYEQDIRNLRDTAAQGQIEYQASGAGSVAPDAPDDFGSSGGF